jgi:anthranilate/para-aminobenzoate synthase component II
VVPGSFLEFPGPVEVGLYAMQVIEKHNLPLGWRAALVSEEGWVMAAQSDKSPQVVILCRPDSVQSMPADAGRRILRAALDWVAIQASRQ